MKTKEPVRVDVYVSPEMWLRLKRLCKSNDRSMSQHVRHLIRVDLDTSVSSPMAHRYGHDARTEREAAR